MQRFWRFIGALWPQSGTDAELPTVGTGDGYVPTLQTDNTVKWRLGGGADAMIDDATGDIIVDDATGQILHDG